MSEPVQKIITDPNAPITAPNVIVRHRYTPTYRKSIVLSPRYWKHRETGSVVEVRELRLDVDQNCLRVVFFDPDVGRELSMPLKPRPHPFFPGQMEDGFESKYEKYGAFSDRV